MSTMELNSPLIPSAMTEYDRDLLRSCLADAQSQIRGLEEEIVVGRELLEKADVDLRKTRQAFAACVRELDFPPPILYRVWSSDIEKGIHRLDCWSTVNDRRYEAMQLIKSIEIVGDSSLKASIEKQEESRFIEHWLQLEINRRVKAMEIGQ